MLAVRSFAFALLIVVLYVIVVTRGQLPGLGV